MESVFYSWKTFHFVFRLFWMQERFSLIEERVVSLCCTTFWFVLTTFNCNRARLRPPWEPLRGQWTRRADRQSVK